ncbi:zeta toxin family protein [Acutalibacter sp.]|uniref:zeta toxin family protein n=1 Tax=Acutalibacter sp. TaxID=1918636 RepID=UPI0021716CF1|nr:hypothetical protein [Acutalibacter sp.]
MKLYTIIGGVNGCGKSSLTGTLKAERNDLGTIIDPDKLSAKLGGYGAGGRAAVEKINDCLAKGLNFTQETTLAGARTERTIRQAKELGYTIRLYYVGLDSLEESLSRIENRVRKGGHNIPRQDVERRYAGRFEALVKVLPYCDEACFFDNDNGFVEVARYENGELLPITQSPPEWLKELMDIL